MLSKVIDQANVDHFAKWLDKAENMVIVTHVSPDGDAIGSSLGLLHFLESQDKNVRVIVPNAFPDFLRWMDGAQRILRYDKHPDEADKLIAEHGDGFDAIMVFVGTNDYNAGVPIGEWYSEEKVVVNANGKEVERVRRSPVMDGNTYRGRINIVLDKLKRIYPTKQIVLLTPIHRAYAKFGERNVQPDESHQNACGEYVDAYIQSIKEASSIWSVPVVDMHALSGLFPMHQEQKMYFPGGNDWLHPDEDGHRRFALCLYYQLLTLPCRL